MRQDTAVAPGTQTAFLLSDGVTVPSISQTINFPAAGSYVINFQAQKGRNGVHPITVKVDSTVVGTHTPPCTAFYPYTTAPFTVTAGNHTISFTGSTGSGTGVWSLLDAVNIWPVSTNGLPSPWVDIDIGAIAAGTTTWASNTFTVNGSGVNIEVLPILSGLFTRLPRVTARSSRA